MEAQQRTTRRAGGVGVLAVALLLVGGSAALADGQQCYSCGSWCTQQGVEKGMWYQLPDGSYKWVGGTGWAACSPGTQCWSDVGAACGQKCQACLAAGGHYGGPGEEPVYMSCDSPSCSFPTGQTDSGEPTSVCSDFCSCKAGKFCRDTQIINGGKISTQNSVCKCPD